MLKNRNKIVLIVEDEDSSDAYFTEILKNIFGEILHATNGKLAVDICRENKNIDLVLMDIKLPVMDGYQATRKIRQFNKDVIIIAQTAYALQGDREKALKAGCNDYIAKPVKRAELFEIIQKNI